MPGSLLSFDCRPNRWDLIDLPDEPAHHRADAPLVDILVDLHHANVFLVPLEDGLERPGRVGEGDREDAGHARIEGAGVARLRDAEHVPDPGAQLMGRRACRLVDNRHAEPNSFLDRPLLGSRSVFRVGHLVEDDEIAHPPTRAAIFATISSGVRSSESIARSNIRVSPTSIPQIDLYRIRSDRSRARISRFASSTVVPSRPAIRFARTPRGASMSTLRQGIFSFSSRYA